MVSRKYIKDYKLEDSLDARGRIRSKAVYIGGDYGFERPDQATAKAKWTVLGLNLIAWLLFIGALLPNSLAARTMYCVLPLAAAAFPLGLGTMGVFALMTAQEPMRREQADKISQGLPIASLLSLIFSGAALLGFCAMAIFSPGQMLAGDAVFAALSAGLTAVSALSLWLSRRFKTRRAEAQ
jgi:hypothetical protein